MPADIEILLASDFTARSDRPLDRALLLTHELAGRLVIAHVLEKKAAEPEAAAVERLRAELPAAAQATELVLQTGSAPATLARIAAERGSDLIVTGVARYNSLGDYLLGTTVDHLVRHASAPVLVVRRRAFRTYTRLVVATDFSECSRAALVAAAKLLPRASIMLVHAVHVPYESWLKSEDVQKHFQDEAHQQMALFLQQPDVATFAARIQVHVEQGEIGNVLGGLAGRTGEDLLVLGTHGRSGFAHATIGSHAEALLAAADVDVLMVREQMA